MWAHCITADIPLAWIPTYGLMPHCEGWGAKVYEWQMDYLEMMRANLVTAGLWDSFHV